MQTPIDDLIRREWVNDRLRENQHRSLVRQALGGQPRRGGRLVVRVGRGLVALGTWLVAHYGAADVPLRPSAAGHLDA